MRYKLKYEQKATRNLVCLVFFFFNVEWISLRALGEFTLAARATKKFPKNNTTTTCARKEKMLVLPPRSYLAFINFSKRGAGASVRFIWQRMNNFLSNLCHLYKGKNEGTWREQSG